MQSAAGASPRPRIGVGLNRRNPAAAAWLARDALQHSAIRAGEEGARPGNGKSALEERCAE
jgi:hypothetical protein